MWKTEPDFINDFGFKEVLLAIYLHFHLFSDAGFSKSNCYVEKMLHAIIDDLGINYVGIGT